jgi:ribosomal protein S27AE
MDTFPDAIAQVYHWSTASNSELREMILDVVCRHIKPLLQKQKFCDALEEIVGFAPDLVKGLAKEMDDFEKYPCLGCGKMIVTRLSDHEERYYCVRCSLF